MSLILDNQMMDLVGEKEILKFLSTLKAPSVTLDKFKDHIEKHRDILDAELIEMNYHIQGQWIVHASCSL